MDHPATPLDFPETTAPRLETNLNATSRGQQLKRAHSIDTDTDTAPGLAPAMQWNSTGHILPTEDALIWANGRYMIASFVEGISAGKKWQVFMDSRTDDLLPWPTHWMPLPKAPES